MPDGDALPTLKKIDSVYVLNLGDGENRFNPEWVGAVETALDEVIGDEGPRALVTTASGKFWSNGLDLEWMGANQGEIPAFVARVHGLFARVLEAPVATVAAIQGHAFAAGAMLAVAHDHAVMREDRGYFCTPEVDIHIPFTTGMTALLMARLPRRTAHEAMTTGRRYGGPDAQAAGIVDEVCAEGEVVDRAVAWATSQTAKHSDTLGAIKRGMYGPVLDALRSEDPGLALP